MDAGTEDEPKIKHRSDIKTGRKRRKEAEKHIKLEEKCPSNDHREDSALVSFSSLLKGDLFSSQNTNTRLQQEEEDRSTFLISESRSERD